MVEEKVGRWRTERLAGSGGKGRKKSPAMTPGEKRRMAQLVACLLLFAMVFFGRGVTWGSASTVGESLGSLIRSHTDFRSAFTQVGASLSQGEPVVQTFGVLWNGIFGDETEGAAGGLPNQSQPQEPAGPAAPQKTESDPQTTPDPAAEPTAPSQEPAPAVQQTPGEELVGQETVTPVLGVLTSGFGPRTHPVDGEWKEHSGIDIQAEEGSDILAFAAGTVDYIGESEAYGLYMQLTHPNGVSSFYAHCSDICVKTGQSVAAGEKIGKVGDTGNATGPHLHLELKKDGTRIDPLPYVETKDS